MHWPPYCRKHNTGVEMFMKNIDAVVLNGFRTITDPALLNTGPDSRHIPDGSCMSTPLAGQTVGRAEVKARAVVSAFLLASECSLSLSGFPRGLRGHTNRPVQLDNREVWRSESASPRAVALLLYAAPAEDRFVRVSGRGRSPDRNPYQVVPTYNCPNYHENGYSDRKV